MGSNGYRLLGFAVWNAAKWYLRRRLPSRRSLVLTGLAGVGAVGAIALLARRAAG